MAYKDKDKQREAVKAATRRYRAKKGDSALSGSEAVSENARGLPVVDEVSDTDPVIPKCDTPKVIPCVIPKCESHIDVSDVGVIKALHQGSTVIPKVTPCEIKRHKAMSSEIQAQDEKILVSDKLISFKPKRGKDKPYQMTVMERLFYRPANKLGRGETNFVSLPGRACYGVVKAIFKCEPVRRHSIRGFSLDG